MPDMNPTTKDIARHSTSKALYFGAWGFIALSAILIISMSKSHVDMSRSTLHCLGANRYFTMQAFSNSYKTGDTRLTGQDRAVALATCDVAGVEAGLTPLPTPDANDTNINDRDVYEVNFATSSSFFLYLLPISLAVFLELSRRIHLQTKVGKSFSRLNVFSARGIADNE